MRALNYIFICNVFFTLISVTFSSTIDTSRNTVRYLTLSNVVANNMTTNGTLVNKTGSYFGYSLSLVEKNDGSRSLSIGSPLMVDFKNGNPTVENKNVTGGIFECDIRKSFADNALTCKSTNPETARPGDIFGLHLQNSPDGVAFACSPTSTYRCVSNVLIPGYCYKTDDFGDGWTKIKYDQGIECNITEVLFVLDGSGSVGIKNFETVKTWVKNITRKLDITTGRVAVGVVQYSYYNKKLHITKQPHIETHIKIGEAKTFQKFETGIDSISLHESLTYTGRAMQKIMFDFNGTENFDKPGTKQVMILLTDGKASDKEIVNASAVALRDKGIITYAVGVGKSINYDELQLIAGSRNGSRVHTANDFDGLEKIAKTLEVELGVLALEGGAGKKTIASGVQFGEVGLAGAYSKSRKNEAIKSTSKKVV